MKRLVLAFFFGAAVLVPLSGFGKEPNDTLNLLETVLQQIQDGVRTKEQLKDFVAGRNPFQKKADNVFKVTVNYDLSVEFLVANGKYSWVNNDITSKNFPTTRKGEVTLSLELVHLNQVLTSEEVLKELDKRGLRPAELHELLSFGAQYPEEQRKYPIVALGSVWQHWHDYRYVPYLRWLGGGRVLSLGWIGRRWGEGCRFVAVSK